MRGPTCSEQDLQDQRILAKRSKHRQLQKITQDPRNLRFILQAIFLHVNEKTLVPSTLGIVGLQPNPRDPKHNGVAAMLDDRTFCFAIQHGRHSDVFLDLQGLVTNYLFSSLILTK